MITDRRRNRALLAAAILGVTYSGWLVANLLNLLPEGPLSNWYAGFGVLGISVALATMALNKPTTAPELPNARAVIVPPSTRAAPPSQHPQVIPLVKTEEGLSVPNFPVEDSLPADWYTTGHGAPEPSDFRGGPMTPVPVHLTADGLDPPVLVSQSVAQNDWSAPGVPEQDLRQSFEFLKTEPRRETASSTAPTTGPANMTSQDAKKLRLEQLRNRLISVKTSPVKSFTTEIPATDLPTENLPDLFTGSQEARPQGSFVDLEPFKDGLHFMSRDELNRIWQDYVALSRHCGRGLDKLNPISFRTQLINNHRAISTTYKCSSIRFRVKLKNGKPSLSARPA